MLASSKRCEPPFLLLFSRDSLSLPVFHSCPQLLFVSLPAASSDEPHSTCCEPERSETAQQTNDQIECGVDHSRATCGQSAERRGELKSVHRTSFVHAQPVQLRFRCMLECENWACIDLLRCKHVVYFCPVHAVNSSSPGTLLKDNARKKEKERAESK